MKKISTAAAQQLSHFSRHIAECFRGIVLRKRILLILPL